MLHKLPVSLILLACLYVPSVIAQTSNPNAAVGAIDLQVMDPTGAALRASGVLAGPQNHRAGVENSTEPDDLCRRGPVAIARSGRAKGSFSVMS